MRQRVGDSPKLLAVLLVHHILWMANYFDDLFSYAHDRSGCVEACRAALTLVLAYSAWLRTVTKQQLGDQTKKFCSIVRALR
jgi:hypothetical protein